MNFERAEPIVRALLYEGYLLYPYRPSLKNAQRWSFGGLYPTAYCQSRGGSEASDMMTECLVAGPQTCRVEIRVRFLHLIARTIGKVQNDAGAAVPAEEFRLVETLTVGDRTFQPWQEAEERAIVIADCCLGALEAEPRTIPFAFPARQDRETLRAADGQVVGVVIREQQAIAGVVELSAVSLGENRFKITVRVRNRTEWDVEKSGEEARMRSLASTHTLLGVEGGEFVSLLDPPDDWREAAAPCQNVGAWPVLVGPAGAKDLMLASPIILYDYPQVAAESPGDLFDATEIDEILTLRILTLTDEEKRQVAAVDVRARELLDRTESLAREQLMNLHGTRRDMRPFTGERE